MWPKSSIRIDVRSDRSAPTSKAALILACLLMVQLFGATKAVPCLCSDNRCTYGYCESAWCLVGIKTSGRPYVVRTCGNKAAQQLQPCLRDVGDWQYVCSCTTPYCNTFAYLRQLVSGYPDYKAPLKPLPTSPSPSTTGPSSTLRSLLGTRRQGTKLDYPALFNRVDERTPAPTTQQSYLIIVLIVVPLAVAVLKVLLN